MRGFEAVFDKCFDLVSFLSFEKLEMTNYTFYCEDSSAYYCSQLVEIDKVLTFNQLVELSKRKLVLERLHLQVYPNRSLPITIKTYDDFLRSSCEMIILAYDGVYLEIYAKKQKWLNQLLINIEHIGNSNVIIKTDETDTRKGMYV